MTNSISDKDKKDWQTFISSKEKIPDKDFKPKSNNIQKIRSIDLHGYTLSQANKAVKEFILQAFKDRVSKLIVVTGKGIHSDIEKNPYISKDLSILKFSVPNFILNDNDLMERILEIKEAKIEDGGSGAFYIFLKNKIKNL